MFQPLGQQPTASWRLIRLTTFGTIFTPKAHRCQPSLCGASANNFGAMASTAWKKPAATAYIGKISVFAVTSDLLVCPIASITAPGSWDHLSANFFQNGIEGSQFTKTYCRFKAAFIQTRCSTGAFRWPHGSFSGHCLPIVGGSQGWIMNGFLRQKLPCSAPDLNILMV